MNGRNRNNNRDRRTALAQATQEQLAACAGPYADHCRACELSGVEPASFDIFFFEWSECDAGEKRFPMSPALNGNARDDFRHQSYERMYEGKKGFE